MSKNLTVVVDADALIAQTNSKDFLHSQAGSVSKFLDKNNARVIYPITAVYEASAHMQRVLGDSTSVVGLVQLMTDRSVEVAEINQKILSKAFAFFDPKSSKKNTLFDCTIAAIAKEYGADAIFSFDKFYKKLGFKLASELAEEV